MSCSMHLIAWNIPGCGPLDSRCLPFSRITCRTIAPYGNNRLALNVKIGSVRHGAKEKSYVCRASSSGKKRNSDFSKQNKNAYYRNRNKQNEDRESLDNFEEPDLLSSKNGPLLSLSNSQRYQATATPGPREKEIVELFRKVQAQLRERAASKDEKKFETSQRQAKESEVDSLLKLLRKHSVEQGKKKSSNSDSRDIVQERQELNGSVDGGKSAGLYDATSTTRDETHDPSASSVSRPVSNFQRRSPVRRVNFKSTQSAENTVNSMSADISKQNNRDTIIETEQVPVTELEEEPEIKLEIEPEPSFSTGDVFEDMPGESTVTDDADEDELGADSVDQDLSALKLSDLRALAKSRGVKGYSKMKKGDLLELLGGSSA